MMIALSLALMFISSIFCYSTFLVAFAGGLLSYITALETKLTRAFCAYLIIVMLSMFFIARKSAVIDYTLFCGFYPIIELKISKLNSFLTKLLIKLMIFFTCAYVTLNLNFFIAGISNVHAPKLKFTAYLIFSMSCLCFDYFLQEFKLFYNKKIKNKILRHF